METKSYGAIICFIGAAITLLDTGQEQGDQTVTVLGDALAFGGAVFVVGYIVVGRILQNVAAHLPLCVSGHGVGALLLLPISWLFEPESFASFGVVGWTDGEFLFGSCCWRSWPAFWDTPA